MDNLLDDYHNSCQLWNLLCSLHLGLEKLDDKICNYDISIDINLKYAPTYSNKGNAMRILRKTKKVLGCYFEALVIELNFAR